MRKTIAYAATAALATSLLAAAPAVAGDTGQKTQTKAPASSTDSKALEDAVTVNGILQHLRELQVIANRNDGNRASGLPGHTASAAYVAKQLKKAGYTVKRQKFTFAFSRELAPATLAQTAPSAKTFETATFDYSGSGDVTGAVVNIDQTIPASPEPGSSSGCEASDFPAAPAGPAVALIQRGTCNFGVKSANAEAAGYDAVIIFNEGQEGRQELLTGTLGAPAGVPVVGLSYADGVALAGTKGATVRVTASTENDLNRETENVIADLPKSIKTPNPDKTVVVGAHLDSVAAGPGINDNGSGSAAVLEIAEQLAALKQYSKKLQRPVRFAFWGAEEAGLLGSQHYVDTLTSAQRAKIYANLNFDMVGSPNYARFVYDGDGSSGGVSGPPGSDAIEGVFTSYFTKKKLATAPTDFDGRSDYGPFIEAGIPAGGLFSGAEGIKTPEEQKLFGGTAGVAYDSCYHQACDTITNINTKALQELGDAAAHATVVLLTSKKGLFPDNSFAPRSAARKATTVAGYADHPAR